MLTDFFPRLSRAHNNEEINILTNEQAMVTMLIGAPLLIIMTLFSPLLLSLLYSQEFLPALEILRVRLFSVLITLIFWPVGVIALAKGKGLYSSINDLVSSLFILLSVYVLWDEFSLLSTSYAYVISGLISIAIVWYFAHRITGFIYTKEYIVLALVNVLAMLIVISCLDSDLSFYTGYSIATFITIISISYSLWKLRLITK
jgi:PST family polysaccharide transporter